MSDDNLQESEIKEHVRVMVGTLAIGISVAYCGENGGKAIWLIKESVKFLEKAYNEKNGGKRNAKVK